MALSAITADQALRLQKNSQLMAEMEQSIHEAHRLLPITETLEGPKLARIWKCLDLSQTAETASESVELDPSDSVEMRDRFSLLRDDLENLDIRIKIAIRKDQRATAPSASPGNRIEDRVSFRNMSALLTRKLQRDLAKDLITLGGPLNRTIIGKDGQKVVGANASRYCAATAIEHLWPIADRRTSKFITPRFIDTITRSGLRASQTSGRERSITDILKCNGNRFRPIDNQDKWFARERLQLKDERGFCQALNRLILLGFGRQDNMIGAVLTKRDASFAIVVKLFDDTYDTMIYLYDPQGDGTQASIKTFTTRQDLNRYLCKRLPFTPEHGDQLEMVPTASGEFIENANTYTFTPILLQPLDAPAEKPASDDPNAREERIFSREELPIPLEANLYCETIEVSMPRKHMTKPNIESILKHYFAVQKSEQLLNIAEQTRFNDSQGYNAALRLVEQCKESYQKLCKDLEASCWNG